MIFKNLIAMWAWAIFAGLGLLSIVGYLGFSFGFDWPGLLIKNIIPDAPHEIVSPIFSILIVVAGLAGVRESSKLPAKEQDSDSFDIVDK